MADFSDCCKLIKRWLLKKAITQIDTPERCDLDDVLQDVKKLLETYAQIGMKCIDMGLKHLSSQWQERDSSGELWSYTRRLYYAVLSFVPNDVSMKEQTDAKALLKEIE